MCIPLEKLQEIMLYFSMVTGSKKESHKMVVGNIQNMIKSYYGSDDKKITKQTNSQQERKNFSDYSENY